MTISIGSMKFFLRLFRKFVIGILIFSGCFLLFELILFFATPIYDFYQPGPFSGNQWFNPYKEMENTQWRKTNFHFHTRAWGGLTSGRNNTHDEFYKTYKRFDYDAPQISNYQRIDKFFKDSSFYIPVYEHGYGLQKKHQLLIGSKKVLWLDYPLYQNVHHKQHIINLLRGDNDIVTLAHPDWENGYPLDQIGYFSNYDLLEVLNHNWRSELQWDSVLSSGRPVFMIASDDGHNIGNPSEIQRCVTYINAKTVDRKTLINSLKTGNAFGAEIYQMDNESFDRKVELAKEIPILNSVTIRNDTLRIAVSEKAFKFNFIGQGGQIKKIMRLTDTAWYKLKPEDTYIRTEIIFIKKFNFPYVGQGTRFLLNPVFRYDGKQPSNILTAEINLPRTWILRIFGYGSLIALLCFILYMRRKRKKQQI